MLKLLVQRARCGALLVPTLLAPLGLGLGGCYAGKSVHMGNVPAESAHYVVVKTKWTGAMVIYDCVSRPDGAWEPTCHQTKMVSAAEAALSGAMQRLRPKAEGGAEQ